MLCGLMTVAGLLAQAADARALADDEQVLFVPDTARVLGDGRVQARVQAWVYEYATRPGLSALLAHHLDLDLDAMAKVDRERFYARTQLFRVDSQSFKNIAVVIDGPCATSDGGCPRADLPRTNYGGRSSLALTLPASVVAPDQRWLDYSVVMPHGDPRQFHGRALLVPETGLSVISDIDDTIKISNVRDRQALMLNTFAREFVAVPEMAARYRQLAEQPGSAFHYVSSGPIQLYPTLARFLEDAEFPAGSMHLRESTAYTNVIPGHDDSRKHKLAAIGELLADFPKRQFLLIGDSGEADPEIYGEMARSHTEQIIGIRIRNVTGENSEAARYGKAFAELPAEMWQVFTEPATIRGP